MDLGLAGKVAVITGAGSGIGAAIAVSLAQEGCVLHLADLQVDSARRLADSIGPSAHAHPVDVADPAELDLLVRQVLEHSASVDVLVHSAGVLGTGTVLDATAQDWQRLVQVNLSGAVHAARAVIPAMSARGRGRIVNIASVSAFRGGGAIGNTLYGATKAGVVALTKGLGRELGPSGISVNAIAPSVVDTEMTSSALDEHTRAAIESRTPLRRLCRPDEVAALATFLASETCAFLNGETVVLDGGFLSA